VQLAERVNSPGNLGVRLQLQFHSTRSAWAFWKAAWRFRPIRTNVDRRIISRETIRLSVGDGLLERERSQTERGSGWL